jgi:hypothetical protein
MTMTVGDLLAQLESLDPSIEVRLAMQPSWPFEYSIARAHLRPKAKPLKSEEEVEAMSQSDRDRYMEECESGVYADEDDPNQRDMFEPILYLTEGQQLRYLPEVVKNNIDW